MLGQLGERAGSEVPGGSGAHLQKQLGQARACHVQALPTEVWAGLLMA